MDVLHYSRQQRSVRLLCSTKVTKPGAETKQQTSFEITLALTKARLLCQDAVPCLVASDYI